MQRYRAGIIVLVSPPMGIDAVHGRYEVIRLQPDDRSPIPKYLVKSTEEGYVRVVQEDWIIREAAPL